MRSLIFRHLSRSPSPEKPPKPSQIDTANIKAMPTDPTLEHAAMEISQSIKEKAGIIVQISLDIEEMANNLLKQYKAESHVPKK